MTHSKPRHFSGSLQFGLTLFVILCINASSCDNRQTVQAQSSYLESEMGIHFLGQQADGAIALIGAWGATIGQNPSQGAAYFFDLDLLRLTNHLFLPLITR